MGCTYNEAQVRVTLLGGKKQKKKVDAARSESIRMDPGASDAPIAPSRPRYLSRATQNLAFLTFKD